MEDEQDASGIAETVNFTGEPVPRTAKSLFASPPYAPTAASWLEMIAALEVGAPAPSEIRCMRIDAKGFCGARVGVDSI